MPEGKWHYGPRVILPRRIKADLVDGAIAAVIFVLPLLVGQALSDRIPGGFLRLFSLAIPAAILYSLFRDTVARGTSLGKRALGLRVIALEDGGPCNARRVWARNLLDPIPVIGLVDFIWMCVDRHGQKVMDRRFHTQVVEKSSIRDRSNFTVQQAGAHVARPGC
ncbi:MAG TPA: RDD family protein [Actinomycetota bacterium]|nr:RDD family protein [Actinomycetota bacterium]